MEGKNNNNKFIWIIGIIILIIVILIFMPSLLESKSKLDKSKLEHNLIEDGKTVSSDEIINELIEILKTKDKNKIEQCLTKDFTYYDNNNIEHKYIHDFFSDLNILSSKYDIERRGDTSSSDRATYRIYWNTVEQNIDNGIKRGERGYCLQTITIMLKRVVRQDLITYEVEKIILKNA